MQLYHCQFKVMGSPCELHIYHENKTHAHHVMHHVMDELARLHKKYTRYENNSLTSRINQSAGTGESFTIDDETDGLLNYANACFEQSDGLFDITSGILRHAWNFTSHAIPSQEVIDTLLPKVGWNKILRKPNAIQLPLKDMEIDLGGIVKEYAADHAAKLCLRHDIHHGMVNLGGDIRIIGPHPDGRAWNIGITNPFDKKNAIAHLWLSSGAVTSSGDYERCIVIDNKRYSHILNPKTGWPVIGFSHVSVTAEQCLVSGSVSTIAMLKGEKSGKEWLEAIGLPHLCIDHNASISGTLYSESIYETE